MPLPTYANFEEKSEHFKLHKIEDVRALKAMVDNLKSDKGIFRGISSASYKIFTSLQRQIIEKGLTGFSTDKYLKNFINTPILKQYFSTFKIVPSKLSIYSFLQHYGAPTPILDFTSNLETAFYFAIEKFDIASFKTKSTIEDFFTIFFIHEKDLELLEVPKVIEGLKSAKEQLGESLKYYEDYSEEALINHIDSLLGIKTLEIFLINHYEEFTEVYNTYNNIRIIAQSGLFIHNSFPTTPFEVGLKTFFIDATRFYPSPWDEVDTPQSREINAEYEETLKRNRGYQKRLEENIIHSFEIHKSLIPEVQKLFTLTKDSIYPDPEKICWNVFEQSK